SGGARLRHQPLAVARRQPQPELLLKQPPQRLRVLDRRLREAAWQDAAIAGVDERAGLLAEDARHDEVVDEDRARVAARVEVADLAIRLRVGIEVESIKQIRRAGLARAQREPRRL